MGQVDEVKVTRNPGFPIMLGQKKNLVNIQYRNFHIIYSSNFHYVRIIAMCEYYKCNKNVF